MHTELHKFRRHGCRDMRANGQTNIHTHHNTSHTFLYPPRPADREVITSGDDRMSYVLRVNV